MAAPNITQTILTFVLHKFPLARKRGVTNTEPLLESGILDSMGVLELVEFVESKFEIKITDDELLPENFGSVQQISDFVESKRLSVPAQNSHQPSGASSESAASSRARS